MGIKYILFDLDGTLLNTNELIVQSFQHTYREHLKREVPREEIVRTFGEILRHTLERECPGCGEEAILTYRGFQVLNFDKLITIHAGVKEALDVFRERGFRLGVVTSRLNESALRGLKLFHLEDYFDVIVGANDTDQHKPDPTPILMALDKMGGTVDEAMMVGDSPFDVLAGKNAEVVSVAVRWSALPFEMVMECGPDYVVDSMEELVGLVEKLNR